MWCDFVLFFVEDVLCDCFVVVGDCYGDEIVVVDVDVVCYVEVVDVVGDE